MNLLPFLFLAPSWLVGGLVCKEPFEKESSFRSSPAKNPSVAPTIIRVKFELQGGAEAPPSPQSVASGDCPYSRCINTKYASHAP